MRSGKNCLDSIPLLRECDAVLAMSHPKPRCLDGKIVVEVVVATYWRIKSLRQAGGWEPSFA